LLHGIARSRDYTFRLVERMNAQGFPGDDFKAASARARDAVEALYQVATYLDRVAKLPKWAGGQMSQYPPFLRACRRWCTVWCTFFPEAGRHQSTFSAVPLDDKNSPTTARPEAAGAATAYRLFA
jgi:hypothetical protein